MNFTESLECLKKGQKVRRKVWEETHHCKLHETSEGASVLFLYYECGDHAYEGPTFFSLKDVLTDDWELYQKPKEVPMVYLASPYTHEDYVVRMCRRDEATLKCAELAVKGLCVFSPIVIGCAIEDSVIEYGAKSDHNFWMNYCLPILARCDRMLVYRMEGWEDSKGIAEEIRFCEYNNIPVEFID